MSVIVDYFALLNKFNLDYIIIGQGLAGSALAIKLIQRQKRVLVVDQPALNTSSSVAAGLFNPITGRKMVKTWMADKLFPALHTHYTAVEALTRNTFFYPMMVYRPFISVEEQNEWMGKSSDNGLTSYIEEIFRKSTVPAARDPFGGLALKQCGYLDTRGYINSVRELLRTEAIFLEEDVADTDLEITTESVVYKRYVAKRVVFCSGAHSNAWFGWLPIQPLKGEAIEVTGELPEALILNRGVYVVPSGRGSWRVGATYNFNDQSSGITEKSRKELTERLQDLIQIPFTIASQQWGIRPTTPDRRPILGKHPEWPSAWVFNGMGTKGVSLSPYFAEVLIRSMENGEPLNKEVDVERYKLLYWTSPK